ncbi:CaiB/BaiF CoA transferase family protein [Thermodesulfobacteriota bacterium]
MNNEKDNMPFSPYRVLDITDEKGYLCGKIFADLGADVIKIEPPGGDSGRNSGPFYHDIPDKNKSLFYYAYNTNKRGITLNIDTNDGQDIFKRLVKDADFVIESFNPGFMDKNGLSYSALSGINPRVIMVSITPFGQSGPYKDWKASDIVSMAMGGLSHIAGNPDRAPARVCIDQTCSLGSVQAAMGAMIAHYCREAGGKGQYVDVSIQESVVLSALTVPQAYDLAGFIWPRAGAFLARSGKKVRCIWPCKDGYISWRIFGGGLGVKTRALVEWMDTEGRAGELIKVDWRKMDYLSVPHEDFYRWQDIFYNFFKTHTKEELCQESLARGVVLFASSTPKDLLEDPQLGSRDFWTDVDHPELSSSITYPGPLYKSTEIDWVIRRAPLIGEHNSEVYEDELGFSKEMLAILKHSGVI